MLSNKRKAGTKPSEIGPMGPISLFGLNVGIENNFTNQASGTVQAEPRYLILAD